MPSKTASPRTVIDSLNAYIDQAHDMLEKGEYMELSEMNGQVQELCSGVMALPVEDALLYKDELQELMESLDDLKAHMESHKAMIGDQLGGLGHSKKAAKAYSKSSHMSGGKKEE